jgi:hypothetical protein
MNTESTPSNLDKAAQLSRHAISLVWFGVVLIAVFTPHQFLPAFLAAIVITVISSCWKWRRKVTLRSLESVRAKEEAHAAPGEANAQIVELREMAARQGQ